MQFFFLTQTSKSSVGLLIQQEDELKTESWAVCDYRQVETSDEKQHALVLTALITDSQTLPRCEVTSGLIDVMESAGVLINHKSVTERSEGSLSVFTSAVRQEHEENSKISVIYTSLIIFVHFVEYCHVWLTADFRSDHMSKILISKSKPRTAPLHLYT